MEPQENWNTSEKDKLLQPGPPPYQDYSAYPAAGTFPSTSGYQSQQYAAQGMYPGQPVTVQPTVYVTNAPLANPLPDYMGYSIFTLICCCFPLGIAALIYSFNTRNANMAGQQLMAERNSRMARIMNRAAFGVGLAFIVLYIVYFVVVVNGHSSTPP